MDPSEEVCRSLVIWVKTLTPTNCHSLSEISDGVALSQILEQIAPDHFGHLHSKMKQNVGSNWRLKISNLKKILESVVEYYQDRLNLNVLDNGKPDVSQIAECSSLPELGKLLRLILGCAVNCDKKQDYITQIMDLEESVQRSIMSAIQELEEVTGNTGRSGLSLLSMEGDTKLIKLMGDLEAANDEREMLAQKCHELENQVQCVLEEKQALLTDNQLLTNQLQQRGSDSRFRTSDNRRQVELLKEEIFKFETARDDYRAKVLEQDKQISALQEKIAELQVAADTAERLKDEVDALSESADKVQALENTIASYKKKLEDYADAKKQLKNLDMKNVEYYKQNLEYEEELKNMSVWRNQCEVYKKQTAELQQRLDEHTQQVDRAQFQCKTLESKLMAITGEKERLMQERDTLREEIEEIKLGKEIERGYDGTDVAREMAPTEMKERLHYLEKENKSLRLAAQETLAKEALLDDATSRIEKLLEQNRNVNQKVLELESQLQEMPREVAAEPRHADLIKDYKQKMAVLQDALASKEIQLQATQAKYERNLEKARELSQLFESKGKEGVLSLSSNPMKEMEQQLLTTAFHKLCLSKYRDAVDEHLAMLNTGQGQSFLARQRQPTPRKPLQPFKSK